MNAAAKVKPSHVRRVVRVSLNADPLGIGPGTWSLDLDCGHVEAWKDPGDAGGAIPTHHACSTCGAGET